MSRFNKIGLTIALAGLVGYAMYSYLHAYDFQKKASLRTNECTIPVVINGELPESVVLHSRKDFVEYIKSHQTGLYTNSISADLTLDAFAKDGEIDWSRVYNASKIHLWFPPDRSYVLEYKPRSRKCMWATFWINGSKNEKHYSIYGCCGDIQELRPGETRPGYGSFPL